MDNGKSGLKIKYYVSSVFACRIHRITEQDLPAEAKPRGAWEHSMPILPRALVHPTFDYMLCLDCVEELLDEEKQRRVNKCK